MNRLDEFESLNLSFWSPHIYIAQEPVCKKYYKNTNVYTIYCFTLYTVMSYNIIDLTNPFAICLELDHRPLRNLK